MAVCDYEYDQDTGKLRVNCLGCLFGASIEDYDTCMSRVIDKVLEVKKVSSIILAKEREYEYDQKQTSLLVEIARMIEEIVRERVISLANLEKGCERYFPKWSARLQYIVINLLRKDPIGAYAELLRDIRKINIRIRKARTKQEQLCFKSYKRNILLLMKEKMEKARLIKMTKPHIAGYHLGDRSLYRQIFTPSVRPNFMLTRYMITPPEHAKSVERYKVGDVDIEIFQIPDTTEHLYYILPPEFRLSEEKYTVLDAARRYMASHRPKTAEFVKSERVREVFYNIGRDMIREMADHLGVHLSTPELDQLAQILTRYTAGLGVLEILLKDEKVQDVYVNAPIERTPIRIFHQDHEECKTNLIPTMQDAESWATRLRIQSGRPLDEANPVLDTDLGVPGGRARFCVITRTLSPAGLGFAIRRHRDKPWTLPLFIKAGMLDPLAAGLLSFIIDSAGAVLIAGGRSSGKTSLLASLMLEILPQTRAVIIEDTLELPVESMRELKYNIQRLKSRSVITMVETEMAADEALRTALRLGDSALIVGEIRSKEAKALWEAMRIGALSNVVAGTIHGESPAGVYDRVVNDLGVPPTSFKATDIIPICKMLRSADGLHRFRRMTEITEVRKEWSENPVKEGGFVPLMLYSAKEDKLKPTDTLVNGESEVLNRMASYVKEWSGNWDALWENIKLRAKIKKTLVEISEKAKKPGLLEAEWVTRSNSQYHLVAESVRKEVGTLDPEMVYREWLKWFKLAAKIS